MGGTCFWPSSRCGAPLLLFMFLLRLSEYCHGSTYVSYDVRSDRICNRFSKREVDVTMTRPVILELRSSESLTSGSSLSINCNFEVEAKGGFRRGVVSVVQKMAFRSQGDNCVDYIQRVYKPIKGFKMKKKKDKMKKKILKKVAKTAIGYYVKRDINDNDYRGARICGDVLFGLHVDQNETLPPPFANPLPPTPPRDDFVTSVFVETQRINPYESIVSDASEVDPKGELKTHLYMSNRPLRVGEEPLKLKIVYSEYQECDGRSVPHNLFHCGYGLCISSALVNDGLVNCPFGDCADETNCTNAKYANITAHIVRYVPSLRSSSSGGAEAGGAIGGLLTFLVISGCIACGVYYCFKRRRAQKSSTPPPTAEDGGDFVDPSKPSSTYYPTQPPAQPPPGGQPGYYPMVPQQQPPGYPGQQPSAYPGYPQAGGYPGQPQATGYPGPTQAAGYPGQPQAAGYPGQPQATGYPGQPPNNSTGMPYPSQAPAYPPSVAPGGAPGYPPTQGDQQPVIGFNAPPLPAGGYPPAPQPSNEAPTAPPA